MSLHKEILDIPKRALKAVGLIGPDDPIDEEAIYGPTAAKAGELYGGALSDVERARALELGYDIREPTEIAAPVIGTEYLRRPEDVALRQEQIAAARGIAGAPSAAASQFEGALARIASEQMGAAAQARGVERAGARREAMLGIGQAGIEAARLSAAEAAREEQAKRTGATQALAGVRESDVSLAREAGTTAREQAGLTQGAVIETGRQQQARDIAMGQQKIAAEQARTQALEASQSQAKEAARLELEAAKAKAGASEAQQKAETESSQRLVTAGTTAAMLSDLRAKENVRQVPKADLDELAREMRAVTYRYRNGIEDGGERERVGVVAQDLEKSRLGRLLVGEDETGTKTVDYAGLAALMAAAAAKSSRKRA